MGLLIQLLCWQSQLLTISVYIMTITYFNLPVSLPLND